MKFECDIDFAAGYKSQQQISRVLSEQWFGVNGYCLACESDQLFPTPANTQASDFSCRNCEQIYELKAFRIKPKNRLVDGAYSAMISRIKSGSAPTLLLLERTDSWRIQGLTAVHHLFLTPEIIEMRKPLSSMARRAGWVGCNIRLDTIGPDAQISLVSSGVPVDRRIVREKFQEFERLKNIPVRQRGWTTFTLGIIRNLQCTEFSLNDVYLRERAFATAYPNNHNVRAKIRQQLQVLRDLGYLEFHGYGQYRLLI
ncbi:DpnI domain-containing protein [Terracidiphilus gabretensis]|uniref:DpnI domain-containing protein n=1 Tax=Terracidiphilus gabretensis TaxID=1577687 RepID=UPI00071B9E68|nr:DpnI domain-containing protein [Terracidiphilus gabretensis]